MLQFTILAELSKNPGGGGGGSCEKCSTMRVNQNFKKPIFGGPETPLATRKNLTKMYHTVTAQASRIVSYLVLLAPIK